MTIGRIRTSIFVAVLAALYVAPPAHAQLSGARLKCAIAIAKNSQKYVAGKTKLLQKCRNANLKDGSCPTPDAGALAKLDGKLDSGLTKACSLTETDFRLIGFPGSCSDPTPGDDFTLADLKVCMKTAHDNFISQALDIQYDTTVSGPLGDDLKCQAEVAKQSASLTNCILKSVSKCRDALLKGKPLGVPPDFCAFDDLKTSAAIAKCESKLSAGIAKKCTATQVTNLKICTPDQVTAGAAATCLIDALTLRIDGTEIIVPPDLIDYEYAGRGGLCGDNVINNLDEECDGPDDAACPGLCGTATSPDGHFACLCKDKPRMRIVEHADADTDNGWTGQSSDGDVVEGGGYVIDLYDCDMSGLCIAGPNCTLPPHSSCAVPMNAASGTTSDSICSGLGQGTCRKERTATGPHCFQDINKKCNLYNPNDSVCSAPGDYCTSQFHGAPVAAAAGGVAVCNVSVFSEDVAGTVNLVTGESSVKVRQRAITYQPLTQDKPCPVCGGFCGVDRERCSVDADCGIGMGPCITEPICSDGARKDKPCRLTPPFGGPIPFFGTTSVDCLPLNFPNGDTLTADPGSPAGGGLDINANPRTTGSVSLTPAFACTQPGFNVKRCLGGTSEGRLCTVDSECPGGTCSHQCFCSGQGRPNACAPACVGGVNDGILCSVDADCTGGFCHPADCRLDPMDTDSNQEGICTSGPTEEFCSLTTYRTCDDNSDCQPSFDCPFCQPGETCVPKKRGCFVNSGLVRTGTPGSPERETAGVYCVPSNDPGINISAGFPGPGALIQRETVIVVP